MSHNCYSYLTFEDMKAQHDGLLFLFVVELSYFWILGGGFRFMIIRLSIYRCIFLCTSRL